MLYVSEHLKDLNKADDVDYSAMFNSLASDVKEIESTGEPTPFSTTFGIKLISERMVIGFNDFDNLTVDSAGETLTTLRELRDLLHTNSRKDVSRDVEIPMKLRKFFDIKETLEFRKTMKYYEPSKTIIYNDKRATKDKRRMLF